MRASSFAWIQWLQAPAWFVSGGLFSAALLGYAQELFTLKHMALLVFAAVLAGILGRRAGKKPPQAEVSTAPTLSPDDSRLSERSSDVSGLNQARAHVTDATSLFRGSVQQATQEMVILEGAAHGLVVELERSRGSLDRVRRERGRFTRSFEGFVRDFTERATEQEAELEDALRFGLQIDVAARMVARIAKETAMIALNASLEAQRVGAEGAGFHVIALELRKLTGLVKEANEAMADRSRDIGVFLPSIAKTSARMWEACERVTSEMHGHVDALDANYDDITGGVARALGGGEVITSHSQKITSHLQFEERMSETLARADALLVREIAQQEVERVSRFDSEIRRKNR